MADSLLCGPADSCPPARLLPPNWTRELVKLQCRGSVRDRSARGRPVPTLDDHVVYSRARTDPAPAPGLARKGRSLVLITSSVGDGCSSFTPYPSKLGRRDAPAHAGRCLSRRPPEHADSTGRLTPFAQLSLDHLKDAASRQVVPERVAKSQRSFTKASPDSEGDWMCERAT